MKEAKFKSYINNYKYKDGRIGGAFINVPKKSLELLEPIGNNKFMVILQEINDNELNLVRGYKCLVCEYRFCTDDKPYCPSCGCEEQDSIEEVYD